MATAAHLGTTVRGAGVSLRARTLTGAPLFSAPSSPGRLRRFRVPTSLLVVGFLFGTVAHAHELITTSIYWTQHISRIFYKRCISCHREGGSSFPLTSYQEARPWAKAIKNEVLNRRMPPWGAVKGFGAFQNNLSLSESEIALISSWVEGGAPEGRRIYLTGMPSEDAFAEPPAPASEPMPLSGPLTLREPLTAVGIRPEKMPEGGSLEVVAHRPNGAVEHLIWLRDYDPLRQRSYYFREPLSLPAGTKLRVHPPQGIEASLLIAAPSPAP